MTKWFGIGLDFPDSYLFLERDKLILESKNGNGGRVGGCPKCNVTRVLGEAGVRGRRFGDIASKEACIMELQSKRWLK